MNSEWQTWIALAVVTIAAGLLVWSSWRRRGHHEGCGCPGAGPARELKSLKRRGQR